MTKEEAIKRINARFNKWALDDEDMKAIQTLIPELTESEDERIRKEIIDFIEDNVAFPGGWISWLEKHKEQQTTEWSEDDKKRIQRIHDFMWKNRKGDTDTIYQIEKDADWLKSLPERFNIQSKQEWSEEDEVGLDAALWAINQAQTVAKDENDMGACWSAEKWIKSLRPPLKDREMKLKILKYLSTRCSSLEFEEVEDYLNNLRPAWKPSEEQMNEPYNAAKIDTVFHPSLW